MQKRLSQLLTGFQHETAGGSSDPIITDICFDSRAVRAGSLFFALPGTHVHGNAFIAKAIARGAAAIVYQDDLPEDALRAAEGRNNEAEAPVLVRVRDARFAMSPAADAFYDSPSEKLAVIGVTGTEGKSSTVSFIWQLLGLCGKKAGFISTVQYSLGDDAIANPEHQTTPEAPIVQRQLYEMVQNGCEYAVVESSSHGLSRKTNRLGDVRFDAGVFMNVTHEHLEFHGTHEQYKSDKANLFRALDAHDHLKTIGGTRRRVPAFGVVNLEDPAAAYFNDATEKTVYGFTTGGAAGKNADIPLPEIPAEIPRFSADRVAAKSDGIAFTANVPPSDTIRATAPDPVAVTAPLPGAFNVYNVLASLITVSTITGIPFARVAEKCPQLQPVKGRMTVIDKGQPFEVIVDYAHTPSSFETIFPPLRKRARNRIIVLFGSGGERDTKKRPEQGRIAARWCDVVILADEDPRAEDPAALLEMIAAGCRSAGKTEGNGLYVVPPRPQAIRKAFALAAEGDIVLLLGKAHENSIIYKDYTMPYDEIAEAEKALAEAGFTGRTGGGSV